MKTLLALLLLGVATAAAQSPTATPPPPVRIRAQVLSVLEHGLLVRTPNEGIHGEEGKAPRPRLLTHVTVFLIGHPKEKALVDGAIVDVDATSAGIYRIGGTYPAYRVARVVE